MEPETLADFAINFGRDVISAVVMWYHNVYEACGLTGLWIGVVILSIVFSIFVVPLRGGADISRGAIGDFAFTRVNTARARSRQAKAEAFRQETRRYRAQQSEFYRSRLEFYRNRSRK